MDIEYHGGHCCGMSHIHGFSLPERDLNRLKTLIEGNEQDMIDSWEDNNDRNYPKRRFNHAYEVVLTDDQMMNWAKPLKEFGFKKLFRWLNDNSGNYCTLLVYTPNKGCTHPAPYEW